MRSFILFFCFIICSSILPAYDSPAPGGKITASFGSGSKGQFSTGIDIQTENVFASEAGELLYYGPDFIAVAHEDSILTLYSQVAASDDIPKDVHIKKGQLLGKTKGGVLHFAVYDLEMKRYINPLLMTDNIKKSELPKVKGLSYESAGGMLSVYMSSKGLSGLYNVQISVDGQVVNTLGFRTVRRKGDALVLDREEFEYGTLYGREGAFTFPGIHLNPGDNSVDVIVTDFYGKKVVFHGRITI